MIENILFFLEIHISKVPAKLLLKSVYFFLRIPIETSCSSFKWSSNNFSISLILMEITFFLYRFLSIGIRYGYQLIIGLSIDYAWCNVLVSGHG